MDDFLSGASRRTRPDFPPRFTWFLMLAVMALSGGYVSIPRATVDHAAILQSLDAETLKRGEALYAGACAGCHGASGEAVLPTARSFDRDALKYGNDPYSMWQTVTEGRGMMAGQTWLTPEERYYVIQFIRERLIEPNNPGQYFEITPAYLASLPAANDAIGEAEETTRGAAEGQQQWGQVWAQANPGDYGRALYSQLRDHASAALTLTLEYGAHLSYDLLRMKVAAAWVGDLDLSETKFVQYRGEGKPVVRGRPLEGLDAWHWLYRGTLDRLDETTSPRAPLPEDRLRYRGHYVYENAVILAYDVMGRAVLEMPEAVNIGNTVGLIHTMEIGASDRAGRLVVGRLGDGGSWRGGVRPLDGSPAGGAVAYGKAAGQVAQLRGSRGDFVAALATGDVETLRWEVDAERRLVLHVPAHPETLRIRIARWAGRDYSEFVRYARSLDPSDPGPDLHDMTRGGASRWNQTVLTRGQLDAGHPHYSPRYYTDEDRDALEKRVLLADDYPYSVDEIGLPYANPWNAWMRPTALDFTADGRLVLATYLGDVWVVSGIDDALESVRWQRIATGLFEPMGVKVVNGVIYVTARDRILRLHDLNGDGETDFYESFYADPDVSSFFHSFAFGLQTDSQGNLYYAKAGQYTDNAHPGDLMRVTPDGKGESLAMGFRTPNGVTVSPDDHVFVSDNQGNWMPANKINLVKPGGYYGYVPNIFQRNWSPDGAPAPVDQYPYFMGPDEMEFPEDFDEPMVWMPQELDNSPGGGFWSDARWGPLGDRFIHSSFGKGWLYHVMPQEVKGVTQGAVVALPFQFEAGVQRVRVNPADGQIYTVGLTGWDDGFASKYGTLHRVRYNGKAGGLLTDARVTPEGIALTFNVAPDSLSATQPANYEVLQWNYKWTQRYGSEDWSIARPGETGRDTVAVTDIRLSADKRSVLLSIAELQPVDQMRVYVDIQGAKGQALEETIYLTIHRVPGR